ncbi:NYN domain-containing protein (plasmid) [Paracoccus seriniphilus]|nr:NYN domain-containing protein [Paracoccus seriniphilus]
MKILTSPLPPVRVRIFVDFWNFQLSLNSMEAAAGRPSFQLDWNGVAGACCDTVNALIKPVSGVAYEGLHVYSSYTDGKAADMKHKNWVETWLDARPGVVATCVKRSQKKSPPKCPACHAEATNCVACGGDMRGMEEKGVDTRIVSDMMSLAWNGAYDVAVLVTADRDFIPVAQELQDRGIKVIHGKIGKSGMDLAKHCWVSFDLYAERTKFERKAKK